jgi:hypothetical protein
MRFFSPPVISPIGNNLKGMDIVFYCKDCDKIVDVIPVGRKFVYKCSICKTKNVAFGTEKSIKSYYRVPEEVPAAASPKPDDKSTAEGSAKGAVQPA